MCLVVAIVSGMITGLIMRSPIFEQIKENDEMFDDQSNWITPSKYIHMYIIIKLLHDLFL